jgi:hypothetical protein
MAGPATVRERSRGEALSDTREPADRSRQIVADLVEYLIVAVPDRESLSHIVPALAAMVDGAVIRILDLAILVRESDDSVQVLEIEAVDSLRGLDGVKGDVGTLLSDHDLELASLAVAPGSAAIVLVTEDRWAEPLSEAARRAGGQIIAGERIPLARDHRTDLLARAPWGVREDERGWGALIVDPVRQLEALADLHAQGVLSREEFERQKAKVLETYR